MLNPFLVSSLKTPYPVPLSLLTNPSTPDKLKFLTVPHERTGNGSGWIGEQGAVGGDRAFLEGKLGKGITFEM